MRSHTHNNNNNNKIASICNANEYWTYWVTLNTSTSSSLPPPPSTLFRCFSSLIFLSTCCIFLWFGNGVNEFSELKFIEKHEVEIEVLVLWSCAWAQKRKKKQNSVRMIFAFDCTDCSIRRCGRVRFFSFYRPGAWAHMQTWHWINTIHCLCATDDLLSFSFNHFNESHSYCLFDCEYRTAWCSLHSTTRDRQPHTNTHARNTNQPKATLI